jgi:hypothetical protein
MENLKGRKFLAYSEFFLVLIGLIFHIISLSISSSSINFLKTKRIICRIVRIMMIVMKITHTADFIEVTSLMKKDQNENTFKMAVDNVLKYLNEIKEHLPVIDITTNKNISFCIHAIRSYKLYDLTTMEMFDEIKGKT